MEPMASTSSAAASPPPASDDRRHFVPKRKLQCRSGLPSPRFSESPGRGGSGLAPTEAVAWRSLRPFAFISILLIVVHSHGIDADASSVFGGGGGGGGGGGTMPRFTNGLLWPPPPTRRSAAQAATMSARSATVVTPPHCSRAIVTASQSSRLTRRSVPATGGAGSSTQMSLNIGVGQTICFRLQTDAESTTTTSSSTTTTTMTTTTFSTSSPPTTTEPEETSKMATKRRGVSTTSAAEKLATAKSRTTAAASSAVERKSAENSGESVRIHESSSEGVTASTTAKPSTTRKRRMDGKAGRRKRRAAEEGTTTTTATESSVLTEERGVKGERSRQDLLHTVTLTQLEHYHTITERYRFAIPEVETNCICECNPLAWTCQADEWMYGECENGGGGATGSVRNADASSSSSSGGVGGACHRTFFPNQPYGTCPNGGGGGGASIGANTAGSATNADSAYGARLCCQLRFRVHRERTFTALRLESATTYAILQYSVYRYAVSGGGENTNATEDTASRDGGAWTELDRRRVRVQLDGSVHNTVLDTASGLKLSLVGLGGRSSTSQLEAGMYFVENFASDVNVPEWRQRGEEIDGGGGIAAEKRRRSPAADEAGVAARTRYGELIAQPLNRITEHDFHKLGWFRIDENGNGFVQSGDIFLEKIHHAKTNNCAEQRFRSVLEASYYVNRDDQNGTAAFRMAEPLSHGSSWWIRSARVYDASLRQAVVVAGEGNHLEVTLTLPSPPPTQSSSAATAPSLSIAFVHNSSRLVDFSGLILVDHFSNSLLNLTVYGARGVLNGVVRQLTDWNGEDIDTFSVNVPNGRGPQDGRPPSASPMDDAATVIARVKPYPVNSVQVVCLRPDDADASREFCRPVQSVELDLEVNTVRNEWSYRVGTCENCNRFSVDGFMKYLNPMNWAKGIHSVSDALMLASDVLAYVFGALIVYVVLTRIVIPLVTCCMCPMQILYKRRKRKSDGK